MVVDVEVHFYTLFTMCFGVEVHFHTLFTMVLEVEVHFYMFLTIHCEVLWIIFGWILRWVKGTLRGC